jgi:alpha-tubulin suppressor-like RCC1 family protein
MRLPRFIAPHGLRLAAVALALSALLAQAAPPVTITPVAGAAHSFFLDSLGRAWAAGDNRYGQFGDSSTHPNLTVAVRVRENVTSISAGTNHTLFLDTDGSVWATGHNLHGQLGDGSIANRRSPVRVQFTHGTVISAVAAGHAHSLFLKNDGTVWASGLNSQGQLGDGSTTNRLAPVPILTGVRAIAAGGMHSLFLKTDGSVWACGSHSLGQLGVGTITPTPTPPNTVRTPVQIPALTDVAAIYAGPYLSFFLKTDATLWATGTNTVGQLGLKAGSPASVLTPVEVLTDIASVAPGLDHVLLLKTDGTLWSAGLNHSGQLGAGAPAQHYSSRQVMTGVRSIAAGRAHSLVVKTDGSIRVFGANDVGQLGDGSDAGFLVPTPLFEGYSAFAAGAFHTLLLRPDGQAFATGANSFGQLGDGTTQDRATPGPVLNAVAAVAAGESHSVFLKTDGTAWTTGDNSRGQLGNATTTSNTTPAQVMTDVAAIAAGAQHTLFLKTDGSAWRTGNGLSTPASFSTGVTAIAASGVRSLLLKTDGTAFLYLNNSTSPEPGHTLTGVAAIACGRDHHLFLTTDGTVWASGSNAYGLAPASTTPTLATPVQIFSGVRAVTAGAFHNLFLKTDGSAWASGLAYHGQLGHGHTTTWPVPQPPRPSDSQPPPAPPSLPVPPVRVAEGIERIAGGYAHSLLLTTSGVVLGMGDNSRGQLGNGYDSRDSSIVVTPSLLRSPADLAALTGSPARFAAALPPNTLGLPEATYQWSRDGLPLPAATAPAFEIPRPRYLDQARYTVRALTPFGETTSLEANLSVNIDPASPDSDGDTLSDSLEFFLSDFGLNPLLNSTQEWARIQALIPRLGAFFTPTQLAASAPGAPVLRRAASTGDFELRLRLEHTTDLGDWDPLPLPADVLSATATAVDIELPPDSSPTRFFRFVTPAVPAP